MSAYTPDEMLVVLGFTIEISGGATGGRRTPLVGQIRHEVQGFEAAPEAPINHLVAGLPNGVGVPWEVVVYLADAETMRSWLELGREVHEWSVANGVGDAVWELDDDGLPLVPAEVAALDVPESVRMWTIGARDAVDAMQRLFPPAA